MMIPCRLRRQGKNYLAGDGDLFTVTAGGSSFETSSGAVELHEHEFTGSSRVYRGRHRIRVILGESVYPSRSFGFELCSDKITNTELPNNPMGITTWKQKCANSRQ